MSDTSPSDGLGDAPERANRLGIVETVYPHTESNDASNYEVDVSLTDVGDPTASGGSAPTEAPEASDGGQQAPANFTYPRVPVAIGQPGIVHGIEEGTLVVVSFFNGNSERPFVTDVVYSHQERAPLCEPGDWRTRIDEAVFETVVNDDGERLIQIGRQPTDRGDLDMGIYMNLEKGSIEMFDELGNGCCFDGNGNVVISQASTGGTPSSPEGTPSQPAGGSDSTSTGGDDSTGEETQTPTAGEPDPDIDPEERDNPIVEGDPNDGPLSGSTLEDAVSVARNAGNEVVDLAEQGISAGQDITKEVADALGDATTVVIPDGNYGLNPAGLSGEYVNAELIGDPTTGDAQTDGGSEGLHTPTLEQPVGTTGEAVITIPGGGEGSFHVRNLEFAGARDGGSIFDIAVTDRNSSAVLADVYMPDGDTGTGTPAPAVTVRGDHAGTMHIRNCHIEGFRDGGIDASAPGAEALGCTIVQGGLVKNCNIANILLSGPDSRLEDCTSVQTGASPTSDPARGVWLTDAAEAHMDGVDVVYEDTGTSAAEPVKAGGTRASPASSSGELGGEIRDSRLKNDHTAAIIDALDGEWSGRNNSFTGSGNLSASGVTLTNTSVGPAARAPTAVPFVSWF